MAAALLLYWGVPLRQGWYSVPILHVHARDGPPSPELLHFRPEFNRVCRLFSLLKAMPTLSILAMRWSIGGMRRGVGWHAEGFDLLKAMPTLTILAMRCGIGEVRRVGLPSPQHEPGSAQPTLVRL